LLLSDTAAQATTYVIFRYDDMSADAPGVRQSNALRENLWQAEQDIDNLFIKYQMRYVVAVIPNANSEYGEVKPGSNFVSFGQDAEKVEFLKRGVKAGRIEVAQHGFSHINYARKNHRHGEFRERSYEEQFKDILQGKNILSKCLNLTNIKTFVPPFNGWDKNTAKAIKKLGFSILSADRSYYHKTAAKLTIIPFTAQLWELETKVNKKTLPRDALVIVLFHPTQIVRTNGSENRHFGIERLDKLLNTLSTMQDVKVVTLKHLANECDDLTIKRYQAANSLHRQRSFWSKLLPQSSWPGEQDWYLYSSAEVYNSRVMHWRTLTIALITVSLFGGLVVRYLIGLLFSIKMALSIDIIIGILFVLALLKAIEIAHKGFPPTGIPIVTASFSVSFLIALLAKLLRKPQRNIV